MLRRHTRKQHRRMSRKSKKTVHRRHKKHSMKHRKTARRTRGGVAPVEYRMSAGSAALQSLAQGGEFAKFHAAQHGGMRGAYGAPVTTGAAQLVKQMGGVAHVSSIGVPMLSQVGYDRAMTTPIIKAMEEATKLGHQQGGRRHRRRTHRKTKSKKHSRRHRRVRGGMAPVTAPTMLLPKGLEVAAGLNPGYVSVEGTAEGGAAALDKQIRGQTWY
jgi:hypothetical protein